MFPSHSPLDAAQQQALNKVLPTLSATQSAWLAGFLSAQQPALAAAPSTAEATKLAVLYGTESGNSEDLASQTVSLAKKKGYKAQLLNLADLTPEDLKKHQLIALVVSTWGEGDPPEAVEPFYKEFMSSKVDLSATQFAVLALGDTSYEHFCKTGRDFDEQLEKLGAKRIINRIDADVDFDEPFNNWQNKLFKALDALAPAATATPVLATPAAAVAAYSKKHPFPSEVFEKLVLNGEGSAKETVHLEFSLEGSGLTYEAGDALAVIPENADDVVAALLTATKLTGNEQVTTKDNETCDLKTALKSKFDITNLSKAVARKYQALNHCTKLAELLTDEHKSEYQEWAYGRQIIDLIEEFPVEDITAEQLVGIMRKLPPRLYSIASSPKAHPGEVHLTVAAVRYHAHGKDRKGVASTYLADEAKIGKKALVYVHSNKNFRLPEDDTKPIIMVGPGTGIAPFRAFIEERGTRNASGDAWLFFGDQHYTYDFLYQLELQEHLQDGALTKLDVAFSRDQPEKIYVQDKMRENASDIYQWLEAGAYFYVCGDASRMAHDVNEALLDIICQQGHKTPDEAAEYLADLKKAKRYQRDVY